MLNHCFLLLLITICVGTCAAKEKFSYAQDIILSFAELDNSFRICLEKFDKGGRIEDIEKAVSEFQKNVLTARERFSQYTLSEDKSVSDVLKDFYRLLGDVEKNNNLIYMNN